MEKIQMPNQAPAAPMPVVIAGTLVKGKENYLTIGAYGVMSIQPPLVYISSMKAHFTNAGIKETGVLQHQRATGSACKRDRLLRARLGTHNRQVHGLFRVLR